MTAYLFVNMVLWAIVSIGHVMSSITIRNQNKLINAQNKINESKRAIQDCTQSLLKPDIRKGDPTYRNKDGSANRSSVTIDDSGQHLPKTGSY